MAVTAAKDSGDPAGEGRSKVRAGKRQKTVRVFNARLALGTLLAVAVLGPAIYAWHAYQVQRTARAFLERADQLEADQDWTTAASYLHRYLSLQPEDSAVRIRMAKTFDRGAKDWRQKGLAVNLYYETLGLIPEKEQAAPRRRLAELLLEIRRFTAAEAEAAKLLAADGKDPQGRRLLALALYAQVQSGAAVARPKGSRPISQVFESALQDNPGDVQLSAILARIYRSEEQLLDDKKRTLPPAEREKQADLLMDQMIHANPASPDAYLARYAYRAQYRLPGAEEDLRLALKYGPDNLAVLLAAAEQARRNAKADSLARVLVLAEARSLGEHILQIAPSEERGYLLLGDIHWESNSSATCGRDVAMRLEERPTARVFPCTSVWPGPWWPWDKRIRRRRCWTPWTGFSRGHGRLLPSGDRAALECFREFIRAKWWLLKGDPTSALPLLQDVVAQGTSPTEAAQSFEAWLLLGRIWSARNEWDQAAAAYEQAALLQPRSAAVWLARRGLGPTPAAMTWPSDMANKRGHR